MKKYPISYHWIAIFMIAFLILVSSVVNAQVDSVKSVQADTVATVATEKKKKKDKFMVYAGANFNNMDIGSTKAEVNSGVGYHVGFAYKRGKFFYWQVGARYNNATYNVVSTSTNTDSSKFSVGAFDIPLTAGINVLSFADRLTALRIFVSGVPSFTTSVGDNDFGLDKDDVNSFIFYGQAGVGFDIAFFMIETGYNYGFQDLLKNYSGSNPGQFYVSLGFRF